MRLSVFLFLLITSGLLKAQDSVSVDTSYWTKGGQFTTSFSQVSLENWAAGGDNSVSLNGFMKLFADYKREKVIWKNSTEIGYGLIRQGDEDFEKTDDQLNMTTQYGYSINGQNLYWSSLLNFRTQFTKGMDEEGIIISKFAAPAYLIIATGLDWTPTDYFSVSYSPISGKFTFVNDQTLANQGAYGVDPAVYDQSNNLVVRGRKSRAELGGMLHLTYKQEVVENVDYQTMLSLFSNYLENTQHIDVNWQNIINMKVNDWLTVNWQIQLLYDEDIKIVEGESAKVQFKSVFGVGFAYNFGGQRITD